MKKLLIEIFIAIALTSCHSVLIWHPKDIVILILFTLLFIYLFMENSKKKTTLAKLKRQCSNCKFSEESNPIMIWCNVFKKRLFNIAKCKNFKSKYSNIKNIQ